MGSGLHQILKSLSFNTEWSYAVFWKLKHSARMVLAWEDAYYNSRGESNPSDKCFSQTLDSLHDGDYSRDLLGLAVAMMSSHVYSVGEGIVGQVAVTGKHKWIVADGRSNSSCSLFEHGDWQNQFSAGIRTIAVVSVVPHGVLQLGSLNEVVEDTKLVAHIRNLFFALQGSSMVSNMLEYDTEASLCSPNLPRKNLTSVVNPDRAATVEEGNVWFPHLPYVAKQNEGPFVSPISEGDVISTLFDPKLNIIKPERQSQGGNELLKSSNYVGETSGSKEKSSDSEHNMMSCSINRVTNNFNAHSQIFPMEKLGVNLQSGLLDNDSSVMKVEQDLQKREFDTFLKFTAGCELFEALGPGFQKKSVGFDWEGGKNETGTSVEIPGESSSNKSKFDSGPEHLLEAVVANFCHSGSEIKTEKSFSKSVQSLLTAENTPTVNSSGYSIDRPSLIEEGMQNCLNSSELSGVLSSRGFSSPCPSTCSEPLERSLGSGKNKKRARPGESCRPRPRDRQLIQDRIKELRELVPSGSKCSIDSLLERTIKHMLFLQSITKHADKLNKCSDLKSHSKEMGMQGSSSCEQGSSWAVEVGSHLKVCSIVVENLNKNGQMLVEMLCEECSHFLEIAEAIRSLGLTILKGVTETRSEKTWICFVVEGQNNRSIHRMDILWSLVQILQPNATV